MSLILQKCHIIDIIDIVVNNIVNDIETQNDGKIIDTKKNLDDSNANKKDDDILNFYMQCKNNCKIGLMNINSLRHKFYPIMQMLQNQYFDILMLQETKLDDSFPNAQFNIDGYVMHRLDHKSKSGGIIVYVVMYVVIFLRRKLIYML